MDDKDQADKREGLSSSIAHSGRLEETEEAPLDTEVDKPIIDSEEIGCSSDVLLTTTINLSSSTHAQQCQSTSSPISSSSSSFQNSDVDITAKEEKLTPAERVVVHSVSSPTTSTHHQEEQTQVHQSVTTTHVSPVESTQEDNREHQKGVNESGKAYGNEQAAAVDDDQELCNAKAALDEANNALSETIDYLESYSRHRNCSVLRYRNRYRSVEAELPQKRLAVEMAEQRVHLQQQIKMHNNIIISSKDQSPPTFSSTAAGREPDALSLTGHQYESSEQQNNHSPQSAATKAFISSSTDRSSTNQLQVEQQQDTKILTSSSTKEPPLPTDDKVQPSTASPLPEPPTMSSAGTSKQSQQPVANPLLQPPPPYQQQQGETRLSMGRPAELLLIETENFHRLTAIQQRYARQHPALWNKLEKAAEAARQFELSGQNWTHPNWPVVVVGLGEPKREPHAPRHKYDRYCSRCCSLRHDEKDCQIVNPENFQMELYLDIEFPRNLEIHLEEERLIVLQDQLRALERKQTIEEKMKQMQADLLKLQKKRKATERKKAEDAAQAERLRELKKKSDEIHKKIAAVSTNMECYSSSKSQQQPSSLSTTEPKPTTGVTISLEQVREALKAETERALDEMEQRARAVHQFYKENGDAFTARRIYENFKIARERLSLKALEQFEGMFRPHEIRYLASSSRKQ